MFHPFTQWSRPNSPSPRPQDDLCFRAMHTKLNLQILPWVLDLKSAPLSITHRMYVWSACVHLTSQLMSVGFKMIYYQMDRCFVKPFLILDIDLKNISSHRAGMKDKINCPIASFHPIACCRTNVDLNWISKRQKKSPIIIFASGRKCDAFLAPHCEMRCYLSCKENKQATAGWAVNRDCIWNISAVN